MVSSSFVISRSLPSLALAVVGGSGLDRRAPVAEEMRGGGGDASARGSSAAAALLLRCGGGSAVAGEEEEEVEAEGRGSGEKPRGRTPPLFNHSHEGVVGSRCAGGPHGVAVYDPDQPISNEPHEGPQGAADPMT